MGDIRPSSSRPSSGINQWSSPALSSEPLRRQSSPVLEDYPSSTSRMLPQSDSGASSSSRGSRSREEESSERRSQEAPAPSSSQQQQQHQQQPKLHLLPSSPPSRQGPLSAPASQSNGYLPHLTIPPPRSATSPIPPRQSSSSSASSSNLSSRHQPPLRSSQMEASGSDHDDGGAGGLAYLSERPDELEGETTGDPNPLSTRQPSESESAFSRPLTREVRTSSRPSSIFVPSRGGSEAGPVVAGRQGGEEAGREASSVSMSNGSLHPSSSSGSQTPHHSHHQHHPSQHLPFAPSSQQTPASQRPYWSDAPLTPLHDHPPRPISATPSTPPSAHSHSHHSNHSHSQQSHGYFPSQNAATPYGLGPIGSSSALSHSSSHQPSGSALSHSTMGERSSSASSSTLCGACNQPVTGPFVRALKTVFHLECFKCQDCNAVVAAKFFPIEASNGKQYPLCETDYFRRLDLICNTCGMALRGSYITACQKKFHVEHFTCSACPTLFGPQDSYYEHDGDVYCHFHYSTRFATKCVGCGVAILKQFVEINRNQKDECWHPECYMIQKFWNVKLVSRFAGNVSGSSTPALTSANGKDPDEELNESALSLKEKQQEMEEQVSRVWTVLSAFEESSAACISEMLSNVSNSLYMEAVNMAEMFIFHVEVLFAAIDELEVHFVALESGSKDLAPASLGMAHVREAKLLCRTTVNFFSLLAHTQESGSRRPTGITTDLFALVTRLAHYLKILIRIALTGALKLEREHADRSALESFLQRLSLIAKDGGDPAARRRRVLKHRAQEELLAAHGEPSDPHAAVVAEKELNYGYASLFVVEGESMLRGDTGTKDDAPLDLCVFCKKPVEEDCVRLGIFPHWHSHCVKCSTCGKPAAAYAKEDKKVLAASGEEAKANKNAPPRRPPANVHDFVYVPRTSGAKSTLGSTTLPEVIYCLEHAPPDAISGFNAVTRLEQFSYLLNAALRRLYNHLKEKGVVASVASSIPKIPTVEAAQASAMYDAFRDSNEMKRMKSVNLDRKLSSTSAHVPKRSTVVESPSGKVAKSSTGQAPKELPPVPPLPVMHEERRLHSPQPGRPLSTNFAHHSTASSSRLTGRPLTAGTLGQQTPTFRDVSPSRPPYSQSRDLHPNSQSTTSVIRPSFARNNTSIRIVNEPSPDLAHEERSQLQLDPESLFDDHLTLSDLPSLIEAEQARVERRPSINYIAGERKLIADLSPVQSLIIKHFAVLQLQKSVLSESFDLDEILELMSKKNNFWNKLFKGGKEKEKLKKKGVFAVPLDQLVDRAGSDSVLGATAAHLKVPTFLEDIIAAMKQMDMSVEGIFRKNGNIRRLKDICDALDRDPTTVNLAEENPVQLAALLKKFLRDMPDPLLTFKLHRLFCASQTLAAESDRKRYLHLIVCLLPRYHRDTMEILFVFLKWVASFSHVDEETGSKMDLQNLATVIAPSILYSKGGNPLRDESFVAIKAVALLLQMQDEFYVVPDELDRFLNDGIIDFFEKSLDIPPKEMLKSCSKINIQIQEHRRTKQRSPLPPPIRSETAPNSLPSSRMTSHRSDTTLSDTTTASASNTHSNLGLGPPPPHHSSMNGNGSTSPSSSIGGSPRPTSWAQDDGPPPHPPPPSRGEYPAPSSPRRGFQSPLSSSDFERRSAHLQPTSSSQSSHISHTNSRPLPPSSQLRS